MTKTINNSFRHAAVLIGVPSIAIILILVIVAAIGWTRSIDGTGAGQGNSGCVGKTKPPDCRNTTLCDNATHSWKCPSLLYFTVPDTSGGLIEMVKTPNGIGKRLASGVFEYPDVPYTNSAMTFSSTNAGNNVVLSNNNTNICASNNMLCMGMQGVWAPPSATLWQINNTKCM